MMKNWDKKYIIEYETSMHKKKKMKIDEKFDAKRSEKNKRKIDKKHRHSYDDLNFFDFDNSKWFYIYKNELNNNKLTRLKKCINEIYKKIKKLKSTNEKSFFE